jgi:tetratricopeptide (TPR) repeat protein
VHVPTETEIDALSREIVRGVGLASEEREAQSRPIAEITTNSMEAYSYFLLGREKLENLDTFDAIRLLKRAVELDSTFAIAYLYLGNAYSRFADVNSKRAMLSRAHQLSGKTTEKERMYIEAGYEAGVEENLPKAAEILEAMRSRFPKEKQVYYELARKYVTLKRSDEAITALKEAIRLDPGHGASINQLGYVYMNQGLYPEAIECFEKYTALMPGEPNPYDSMGDCYYNMGDMDSALTLYKEALNRKPDFIGSGYKTGLIHIFQEKYREGLKDIEDAMSRAGMKTGGGLGFTGMVLSLTGRYSEAKEKIVESKAFYQTRGAVFINPMIECMRCWSLLAQRKAEAAQSFTLSTLEHLENASDPNQRRAWVYCHLLLGEVDVMQGRFDSAKQRITAIRDTIPFLDDLAGSVVDYETKRLEGNLLLAEGEPDSAIALLENLPLPPQPNVYSSDLAWYNIPSGVPSHCDALARAYLKSGDLVHAAREYERLTVFDPKNKDHRLIHPLLQFRLAQVYESMGEIRKAEARYKKFLDLWKDAEGNPPELTEAAVRLQVLRKSQKD